ncbi:MAG TPA: hypothetical protein VGO50_12745 [Pyrinomonadaceae bacterium]|jgi:hypothetical protein|nr:hypothetical protein [Pyrinomonadaceae bacterium]
MGITVKDIDNKLESLSEDKLEIVYQFVLNLTEESVNGADIETALLSETSLAKDWDSEEEDKAWRHLDALPSC